jgi:Serine dehydrogenase proteinase
LDSCLELGLGFAGFANIPSTGFRLLNWKHAVSAFVGGKMDFKKRQEFYLKIQRERETKVLAFITSDRLGMETQIAQDCVDLFVNFLDQIGPTKRISLILHTGGGDALTAWRLTNLMRTFADEFEVMIPSKALSAGTLISIGADKIVMTKQAALGPIDPSVTSPLNPSVNIGGLIKQVPVSVEAVRGYLDAAREELGIKGEAQLTSVLVDLASRIHPLVIGQIFRSRAQIRFLADKLLQRQVKDNEKKNSIIAFLCADSGSHDYTINRREAADMGLHIEKPSVDLYQILRNIQLSYSQELKLLEPYTQQAVVAKAALNEKVAYREIRGLVESADGGSYGFLSEGEMVKVQVMTPQGTQEGISDIRTFEGWKRIS